MKMLLKIFLPVAIIAAAVLAFSVMMRFRSTPPKTEAPRLVQTVEVLPVTRKDVKLTLPSQGMIEAERTTVIAAEVAGRIIKTSPKFDAGEFFEEGEILAEIDPADYEAAATQAEAALADARLALVSEQAKAEQAVRDWQKLAVGEKPTDLAVRKPQIESATARVRAAEAALVKAQRDLQRTKIRSPYAARVRTVAADLGSFVTPGARIAEVYSTAKYEVRLPVSLDDFAFMKPLNDTAHPGVTISASFGGTNAEWKGRVSRTEGEVERTSRSVILVGEIEARDQPGHGILKPGLFVRARIEGSVLKNVFRVPRRAFLDEQRVMVVDSANKLRFREVSVVRADGTDLLVAEGLKDGETICVTALAAPVDGMDVRIVSNAAVPAKADKPL